jgi:hypothetical protein
MDKAMRTLDAHMIEAGPSVVVPPTGPRPAVDRPLLYPDTPAGPDELGRDVDAGFLAEVLLHKQVETPFCLGLFGAPGSGKTSFLDQIGEAVQRLGGAAGGRDGPFLEGAVVVRVDASMPGEPGALLAGAVLDRLAATHPALAADLLYAGADPSEEARKAAEALNDIRRLHESERQTLDDLTNRDGRMVEAVLESPGSSIDAYARGHRSPIERSLRQFGFSVIDPIATYKQLVREAAEQPAPSARVAIGLRALWAYRGQTRLLLAALFFALLAWAVTTVADDQDSWLSAVRGMGDKAAPVADWAQAHIGWLGSLHTLALIICLLALATVALRAARFLRPIFKGATLLRHDLDVRRRDLKGLLAHQTRRVDGLAADVDTAARRANEAERRAGARPRGGPERPRVVRASRPDAASAAFFGALASAMESPGETGAAPRRILVLIDDLDLCSGVVAAGVLDAARRLLGPGILGVVAGSRSHLIDGFSETDPAQAFARFERCVQVGYRLDAGGGGEAARAAYASLLAGTRPPFKVAERGPALDRSQSALDRPWRPREAETVAALSGFAGETPRAIKRFVNLYRIARADPHLRDAPAPVFTALALALALDAQGLFDDLDALERVSHGDVPGEQTALRRALAVAREASGVPVELGEARRALAVAGRYATRG